jgi:pimeloyl-ACP methyl ester carboxylesterase
LDDFKNRQSKSQLKVPAFFIRGEYDYNCPWELVKDYNETVSAPAKGFYKIPNAAHSPLWENPEETCRILRDIKEKTQNG